MAIVLDRIYTYIYTFMQISERTFTVPRPFRPFELAAKTKQIKSGPLPLPTILLQLCCSFCEIDLHSRRSCIIIICTRDSSQEHRVIKLDHYSRLSPLMDFMCGTRAVYNIMRDTAAVQQSNIIVFRRTAEYCV